MAHLLWHMRVHLLWHLRHMRSRMLLHMLRWSGMGVVGWERLVGTLTAHAIAWCATHVGLGRCRSVPVIVHMRRTYLRATMWTAHTVGRHRWLRVVHPVTRDERLRFGVESVAVIAARNRMLAFRVMRIDINRQLTESIGDPKGANIALGLGTPSCWLRVRRWNGG